MSSKYIAYFLEEVSEWQRKLSNADQVIQVWFEVQRAWMHLESIFIGSEDIRRQLPEDSKRFDNIDKQFRVMFFFLISSFTLLLLVLFYYYILMSDENIDLFIIIEANKATEEMEKFKVPGFALHIPEKSRKIALVSLSQVIKSRSNKHLYLEI